MRGGSALSSSPLPFYIPFCQKSYEKVPLSHSHVQLGLINKLLRIVIFMLCSLNKTDTAIRCIYSKYFDWRPFLIPKWPISLPFYIPKAWKRYPFQAEPPHIGHYREYPTPDYNILVWKFMLYLIIILWNRGEYRLWFPDINKFFVYTHKVISTTVEKVC